ncbi:MAG: hypothetical protein ABIF08_04080 [Nanoarchaeota archaeon]
MGIVSGYFGGVILMLIFIVLIVLMGFLFKVGSAGDAFEPLVMGMQGEKLYLSGNDFFVLRIVRTFIRGMCMITMPSCVFII